MSLTVGLDTSGSVEGKTAQTALATGFFVFSVAAIWLVFSSDPK